MPKGIGGEPGGLAEEPLDVYREGSQRFIYQKAPKEAALHDPAPVAPRRRIEAVFHAAEEGGAVIGNARRSAPVLGDLGRAFRREGREAPVQGILEPRLKGLGARRQAIVVKATHQQALVRREPEGRA